MAMAVYQTAEKAFAAMAFCAATGVKDSQATKPAMMATVSTRMSVQRIVFGPAAATESYGPT